jgi:hypothetical protein
MTVTGSSGSNPEHVDYEMLLFILAYKLGFMSTTSGLRNYGRKVKLERDRGDYRFKDDRDMSRCFFVKSRAPQVKVTSNPPQDIRLFASLGSLDGDESGPASCLV